MMWGVLAPNFDADIRRMAVQIGDQDLADELIEVAVIFDHGFDAGGKRPNNTVS
jgi:hypothetical protein